MGIRPVRRLESIESAYGIKYNNMNGIKERRYKMNIRIIIESTKNKAKNFTFLRCN